MKKFKFYLFAILAVALCVGFAACGDDDDDDQGGNGDYASLIVGAWTEDGSSLDEVGYDNYGVKFDANGSYVLYDGSGVMQGTYSIKGDKLYARFYDDYYDEYETEVYNILELTKTKLMLQVVDEPDDIITLYRANSGASSSGDNTYAKKIIGTWSYTGEFTDEYDYNNYGYIFKSNGKVIEFGSGRYETTYKVVGKKLIIYDNDQYEIVELTNTKLVLRDMDDYEVETYYRVK